VTVPFKTVEGRDVGDVRLFTMSTCAWCDKMKELLSENGVKYHYIDLDLVNEEEREETTGFLDSIYPKWGFPCLLFDEKVLILGYREADIRETLGLPAAEPGKQEKAEEAPIPEPIRKVMERLQKFSRKKGASLNPDTAITKKLVEGLLENQKRYGYWACPCRLASGNRQEDNDIVCPCDYWEQDVAEFGACYCGLYVSEKVVSGEMTIKTVPERRRKKAAQPGP
jgi:ferredoxin-thioredoxin reductase catalytic subunit/glutaredoxin